ncbi:MAG: DMT family transporter [Gordonia sp. (in: high G+C Gram-positive bacteria)]
MLFGLIAAVLAALAYGSASVLQARGARSVETADDGAQAGAPSLASTVTAVVTVPYLIGMALDGVGFAANLVADRRLPLFLAQPVVSANLVVTAILAVLFLKARLSRRDVAGIAVVMLALVVLGFASGDEGHSDPRWLHAGVLIAGVIIVLGGGVLLPRLGKSVAVLSGLGAGALFGLMAVSVRIVDGLDPLNWPTLFTDPALYAIVLCGVGGFYLFTVALQTGSVSAASAALVVGETVIPGALGMLLLEDTTRHGWGLIALVAFVAAVAGAVVVATSNAVEEIEAAAD